MLRTITQLGSKEAEFLSRMAAFERGIFTSTKACLGSDLELPHSLRYRVGQVLAASPKSK